MTDYNEIFEYRDGKLFWKIRPANCIQIGDEASANSIDTDGYKVLGFKGKTLKQHRIIWEMHNGKIPEGMQIDHIDRNRPNNLIENLRLATPSENRRNNDARGTYVTPQGTYQARHAEVYLGTFKTHQEARHAYLEARQNG
jgi:hypothetical protein